MLTTQGKWGRPCDLGDFAHDRERNPLDPLLIKGAKEKDSLFFNQRLISLWLKQRGQEEFIEWIFSEAEGRFAFSSFEKGDF